MALLPNPTGPALGGAGGRSTGGVFVTFENLDRVTAILAEVEDSLKKTASGEMRAGAKDIANQIVIPQLKRAARSSPIRMSRALAETARAKSDRVVMVQIGGVNPALKGFRRGVGEGRAAGRTTSTGRASTSRTWRTTLAWGSELGPWPDGRAPRKDGKRGEPVNHYRAPRKESGYWVQPGTQNAIPAAHKAYGALIESIIARFSRYR